MMSILESGSRRRRLLTFGLSGVALLAIGSMTGAVLCHAFHPPIAMAPLHNVAIRSLASTDGIVAIRGRVAERFGNRMVIDDGTGRTLIDVGPPADEVSVIATGSVVTVQGGYDGEVFHPSFMVMPSGVVMPIGPMFGHHGPWGSRDDEACAPARSAPPVSGGSL